MSHKPLITKDYLKIKARNSRIPHPYKLSDAEDFISSANRSNETVFLITARDVVIGACGFAQVDRHPPEIGYWLGTKYWGKGYATEAVRALIDPLISATFPIPKSAILPFTARPRSTACPLRGSVRERPCRSRRRTWCWATY